MASKRIFYAQWMFACLGITYWLGLFASVLALISTCTIFPDLIANGSIELLLSKPIGRVRLFLLKYLAGLMFVALQVAVFCIIAFLIIGFRAGAWEPRVFLAIPLVTLFFSYLFCVCAWLGLVTRSAIASLLMTILIWGCSFGLTAADSIVASGQEFFSQQVTAFDRAVKRKEDDLKSLSAPTAGMTDKLKRPFVEQSLEKMKDRLAESRKWHTRFRRTGLALYGVKTVLPKVSETKELLNRVLLDESTRRELTQPSSPIELSVNDDGDFKVDRDKLEKRLIERQLSQPLWWILGTSAGFEALVLGVCCWIFWRRDF